ncbi:hypothetical protein BDV98DRAFT_268545 [Pterulicium gracile]|uniref:Uncharacterized protein n=1 Tax=Pterulicium gracile TaxID=1884261 RepID=A0A5C3Q551_9AGAR|nr:hypothetical protein BDV98DRAFT_268545 [Pterula gracilis]
MYRAYPASNIPAGYPLRTLQHSEFEPEAQPYGPTPHNNDADVDQTFIASHGDPGAHSYYQSQRHTQAFQRTSLEHTTHIRHDSNMQGTNAGTVYSGHTQAGLSEQVHSEAGNHHANSTLHNNTTRGPEGNPLPMISWWTTGGFEGRQVPAPPHPEAHWAAYLQWIGYYLITRRRRKGCGLVDRFLMRRWQ